MSAADLYERIRSACCRFHGFEHEEELERHVRAIVYRILDVRGALL